MRRVLVGALAVSALYLASGASAMTSRSAPVATPPSAVVSVGPAGHAASLPQGFVGLSFEYKTLLSYLGTDPTALDPIFLRLLANLTPGQSPVLRIGGDSTDWTWWPVAGMRQPPGVTYSVTPAWIAVARALAQAAHAHYILGINLEANSRKIELAEANALTAGIGRSHIAALELGNEPELYSKLGWYRSGNRFIPGRPPSYDFQAFTNQFTAFRTALPSVPVAGPSSGSYAWMTHLSQFLTAEPALKLVTVHSYWLNECLTYPGLSGYPTIPNLLNPHPTSGLTRRLWQYAAIAHAHRVPIRIDEMNSVTCGGRRGVSDVFASALWALNALFEAASDGIDGVNLHTYPGSANRLFGFSSAAGHWSGTVQPEYYGLLMFAQAAPPGSKLLQIVQQHTDQTRVWATLAPNGSTRVVLINDSLTEPHSVLVKLPTTAGSAPTTAGSATLARLLAPSASATTGITFAGQSFGAQTLTGALTGTSTMTTVPPSAGAYPVTLPPASAAMLTITPRPRASARR